MKVHAVKEIQIDMCPEVLKTQQVLPIKRVDRHMPFQRLRRLWIASREKSRSLFTISFCGCGSSDW